MDALSSIVTLLATPIRSAEQFLLATSFRSASSSFVSIG